MRKLSEINEGLWKSSINKAKQNGLRLEDIDDTNIDNLNPSNFYLFDDMCFADEDLILNDEKKIRLFNRVQMERLLKIAKQDGWRLPTYDEICKNLLDEKGKLDSRVYSETIIYRNPTGGELRIYDFNSVKTSCLLVSFPRTDMLPIPYWLEDGEMYIGYKGTKRKSIDIKVSKEITDTPKRIKLIKQV